MLAALLWHSRWGTTPLRLLWKTYTLTPVEMWARFCDVSLDEGQGRRPLRCLRYTKDYTDSNPAVLFMWGWEPSSPSDCHCKSKNNYTAVSVVDRVGMPLHQDCHTSWLPLSARLQVLRATCVWRRPLMPRAAKVVELPLA